MILPDHNFLSAPLWFITTLHIVTLTLHFVAMNFVFGGLVVLLTGRIRDKWNQPATIRYVKLLPAAMAFTVNFGVAPLLFVQLVYSRQIYSASIVSGWFWLGIVAAVIIAYYLFYAAAFSSGRDRAMGGVLLPAVLALIYVSLVLSSVFAMAERPSLMQLLYADNPAGTAVNAEIGIWVTRWLHAVVGAIAVGGFFVALIGKDAPPVHRVGRGFFLWGVVAASVLGIGQLTSLGPDIGAFMRSPAIWLVTIALVFTVGSVHLVFRRKFALAGTLLVLSIAGMVMTRHLARLIVLGTEFDPGAIPVKTDWGPIAVFLAFFVLAIGLVWLLLRWHLDAERRAT